MRTYDVKLEEGQRQLVLLGLAVLSLRSPGFDWALNEIARKIDLVNEAGRAETYEGFRAIPQQNPLFVDGVCTDTCPTARACDHYQKCLRFALGLLTRTEPPDA